MNYLSIYKYICVCVYVCMCISIYVLYHPPQISIASFRATFRGLASASSSFALPSAAYLLVGSHAGGHGRGCKLALLVLSHPKHMEVS